MQEKRRFTRVELKSRARFRTEGTTYEGEMQNLSLSGVFVVAVGKPELGREGNVEMLLAGPKTELSVELRAKVVRHEQGGFGLSFNLESFELDSFLHLRNVIAYIEGDADRIADEFNELLSEQAEKATEL